MFWSQTIGSWNYVEERPRPANEVSYVLSPSKFSPWSFYSQSVEPHNYSTFMFCTFIQSFNQGLVWWLVVIHVPWIMYFACTIILLSFSLLSACADKYRHKNLSGQVLWKPHTQSVKRIQNKQNIIWGNWTVIWTVFVLRRRAFNWLSDNWLLHCQHSILPRGTWGKTLGPYLQQSF